MNGRRYVLAGAFLAVAALLIHATTHAGGGAREAVKKSGDKIYELQSPSWSQTLSESNGGSDGCNSDRFKCVMGGVAVLDMETGLVWERRPDKSAKNQNVANVTCLNMKLGNRKGWRLPKLTELATLLDMSVTSSPKIPPNSPFENVQSKLYWSSTGYIGSPHAWYVDFKTGELWNQGKPNLFYSWCVRGPGNVYNYISYH
jgi:hypothetical protein